MTAALQIGTATARPWDEIAAPRVSAVVPWVRDAEGIMIGSAGATNSARRQRGGGEAQERNGRGARGLRCTGKEELPDR